MEKEHKPSQYKVVTFLKREELEFLDKLEKDLYFEHGINIPRTKLVEKIINMAIAKDEKARQAIEESLIKMFKEAKLQEPPKEESK